jgi:hypothetical protein
MLVLEYSAKSFTLCPSLLQHCSHRPQISFSALDILFLPVSVPPASPPPKGNSSSSKCSCFDFQAHANNQLIVCGKIDEPSNAVANDRILIFLVKTVGGRIVKRLKK